MNQPARYFARVCVFILPGADMRNGRLERDFQIARDIWGVDFDLNVLKVDGRNPVFSNLSSRDFTCEGSGDTAIERQLFELKRIYSPDDSTVAVFYTGTNTIAGSARACTKRRRVIGSPQLSFMNVVFISNTFAPDTLAHEIGHTFFFSHPVNRRDADLDTPGIQNHVEGNPTNVMAPGHIRTFPTTATPEQIQRALQSNSPQVIFERPGFNFGDSPRGTYEPIDRRTLHRFPYDDQLWPGDF